MNCTVSTRLQTFWLSITSSRLIYVLLVDTALTFVLFTFLYQHHFTKLSNSNSIVTLCRTLRTTISTGVATPFRELCQESSLTLNAPPTLIQQFLSVTKEVVIGVAEESNEEHTRIRMQRNWKVLKFVGMKMVGLLLVFGFTAQRSGRRTEGSGLQVPEFKEESFAIVVDPSSPGSPSLSIPPPAYSAAFSPTTISETIVKEEDVEDVEEQEDDTPWILLALSLIGHLSVVLIDQGAVNRIASTSIFRDRWIVLGFVLFSVGMIGIWRESRTKTTRSCEGIEGEAKPEVGREKSVIVIQM